MSWHVACGTRHGEAVRRLWGWEGLWRGMAGRARAGTPAPGAPGCDSVDPLVLTEQCAGKAAGATVNGDAKLVRHGDLPCCRQPHKAKFLRLHARACLRPHCNSSKTCTTVRDVVPVPPLGCADDPAPGPRRTLPVLVSMRKPSSEMARSEGSLWVGGCRGERVWGPCWVQHHGVAA